jgi:hypothetical protein
MLTNLHVTAKRSAAEAKPEEIKSIMAMMNNFGLTNER